MKRKENNQRGNTLLIILVLIAVTLVGGWQFKAYKVRQRIAAEQAQAAAEQQAREEAARKAERERVARETAAMKELDALLSRWNDASKIAGATSRIALAGPVSNLQNLKREAENLAMPECLDGGGASLVKSMDNTVQAYLVFMRNELSLGSKLAQLWFEDATKSMDKYKESRAACET